MNQLPPMTLLDYKVSNKELNMLKTMLPYMDIHFQPFLAMYIKYIELRATIDLFTGGKDVFNTHKQASLGISDILSSIAPYLTPEERESMENMQNILNTVQMFEQYKDMFSPDMMESFGGMDNFADMGNISDIMSMFSDT